MRVSRQDHVSRAACRHGQRELVRPARAGDRDWLARGSRPVCGTIACLGFLRPRFAQRGDPVRRETGRAGASWNDGPIRRRARARAIIFRAMRGFLVRLVITAFGLWLADQLLPGIWFTSTGALILSAFLLGFVNAVIRPILIILTLPLTILTLGLFILIVNR